MYAAADRAEEGTDEDGRETAYEYNGLEKCGERDRL